MIIKNVTQGFTIADDVQKLDSIFDKTIGLLSKKNYSSLLFKTCFGIHTFFLKQPIDILILDNQWKVVKIKKNLQPNRFFFWNPKYCIVVELPINLIKNTSIGDQIVKNPL